MPVTNPLDFSSASAAEGALKKVKQWMVRAGQPVVATEYIDKARRSNSITYREATLTLASGQLITLRVNGTGDIFQAVLNKSVVPIKNHDDMAKAVAELAGLAEKNQAAFQKSLARVKVALPPGLSTPKPKMAEALQQRVAELDGQIAERKATVADLQQQLGAMTDSTGGASSAPELGEWERDVLRALGKKGYLEDGQVSSKDARDVLVGLGYVDRYVEGMPEDQRDNVLTEKGRAALAMLDSVPAMSLAVAYVDARDLVAADPAMLDSAANAEAVAVLRIALDTMETNYPINLEAGNFDQACLQKRNADAYRRAIAMLDSAPAAISDAGLAQLVAIAAVSAAESSEIADQEALAELLALGMVEVESGLYLVTGKGTNALDEAGYDSMGEPYASSAD